MKNNQSETESTATRRHFIKKAIRLLAGINLFLISFATLCQRAWAQTKRILLPKGTQMSSLVDRNPATLDPRNLEVTPLEDLKLMPLIIY